MYAIVYLPDCEIVKPYSPDYKTVKYLFYTISEAIDTINNNKLRYKIISKEPFINSSNMPENEYTIPKYLLEIIEV